METALALPAMVARLRSLRKERGGCAICVGYAIIWRVLTMPQRGRSFIFEPGSIEWPYGCAVLFNHQPHTYLASTMDDRLIVEADDFGLLFGFVAEPYGDHRQAVGAIRLGQPGASIGLPAGRRLGRTLRVPSMGDVEIVRRASINEISITKRPRQPGTLVKVCGNDNPPENERDQWTAEETRLAETMARLESLPLATRVERWKEINRIARLRAQARLAYV